MLSYGSQVDDEVEAVVVEPVLLEPPVVCAYAVLPAATPLIRATVRPSAATAIPRETLSRIIIFSLCRPGRAAGTRTA
jgi:hypothetical protein